MNLLISNQCHSCDFLKNHEDLIEIIAGFEYEHVQYRKICKKGCLFRCPYCKDYNIVRVYTCVHSYMSPKNIDYKCYSCCLRIPTNGVSLWWWPKPIQSDVIQGENPHGGDTNNSNNSSKIVMEDKKSKDFIN